MMLALALGACTVGAGSEAQPPATPSPATDEPAEPAPQVDVTVDDRLYRPGQPVHFTIRVTNPGAEPLLLEFPTGQQFDINVDDGDVIIWRWSAGRMFAQAFSEATLQPGESIEMIAAWDQSDTAGEPVPPGTYTARAFITATPSGTPAVINITIQ
jgi:hypothetical protein